MTETRVVSATGGAKGSKPCQLFWIDPRALEALGEVAGFGGEKYAPHNYRLGVQVSLHMNAAYRHILAFQGGEDLDPESGLPHLAHASWNLLAAYTQTLDHPEMDDRFPAASWEERAKAAFEVIGEANAERVSEANRASLKDETTVPQMTDGLGRPWALSAALRNEVFSDRRWDYHYHEDKR